MAPGRKRVHLVKPNRHTYCGQHPGEATTTTDPEQATCLACLRHWRQEQQRRARGGGPA